MVVRVDESEKFLQFKNWFIENGGKVSDAYGLKNFQITGRGVVAKRWGDINKSNQSKLNFKDYFIVKTVEIWNSLKLSVKTYNWKFSMTLQLLSIL